VLGRPGHLRLAQRAPAGPAGAGPFRARTDQADAPGPQYLGDRPGPGRCRRRGDRGVHHHTQRPPRVVRVFVVLACLCVPRAGSGLSGVTPLNLDASVDVRTLSGATQGYGLGLAFRGDGNGDLYAFLIEDHAVAIQKWVATGARITGEPAPVSVSDLHVGSSGRLRAVATTIDGGQAVHLERWL